MGYSTEYTGTATITPPLNPTEIAYLTKFAETRRMHRDHGPYFIGGSGILGQGRDADIRDYNRPPAGQPGLWCQWIPTDDGTALQWDGNEKFYEGPAWMQYLIDHFLRPGATAQGQPGFEQFTFNHTVNGTLAAQGEIPDDQWLLIVTDNHVATDPAE